jgi:hypothetical protein
MKICQKHNVEMKLQRETKYLGRYKGQMQVTRDRYRCPICKAEGVKASRDRKRQDKSRKQYTRSVSPLDKGRIVWMRDIVRLDPWREWHQVATPEQKLVVGAWR